MNNNLSYKDLQSKLSLIQEEIKDYVANVQKLIIDFMCENEDKLLSDIFLFGLQQFA